MFLIPPKTYYSQYAFVSKGSVNESRCNIVTSSLIGWAHTQNNPWPPSLKLIFPSLNQFQNNLQKKMKHSESSKLNMVGYIKMHRMWYSERISVNHVDDI